MVRIIINKRQFSVNEESNLYHMGWRKNSLNNRFFIEHEEQDEASYSMEWLMEEYNSIIFNVISEKD
ncbi:MAG: hypothetical protein E3J83_04300 [Candidatus Atribacteria bacterium]|nr:MAG: hypothetical protein E3J83_04300 [Candidatus Atribacteria bacterium]